MLTLLTLLACGPDDPADTAPVGPVAIGALTFDGPPPKNVWMLSIDTLRRDHFSRYATQPERASTPFLAQLAAEGVALDDHVQCSNWTFPTVSCTLAGRTHLEGGFLPTLNRDVREPFPPGTPFLATHLADAGYDTWLLSANSWLSSEWGTSQGYAHEQRVGAFWAEEMLSRGLEEFQADRDPDAPWLYHTHLIDPHTPYRAPASWMTELDALEPVPWDLDEFEIHYEVTRDLYPDLTDDEKALLQQHLEIRYRSEIAWMDQMIADHFAAMDAAGLLDDTLVVVWTDHGEQFWERGQQTHAYGLHAEENDAVAFFWAKNLQSGAWTEPTHSTDVVPTLLAILDQPVPPTMTGQVVGNAPRDRIRTRHTQARLAAEDAVDRNGLTLIFDWEGQVRAYDRTVDPAETTDIWDPTDPAQAALWDTLRTRVEAEHDLAPHLDLIWPEDAP